MKLINKLLIPMVVVTSIGAIIPITSCGLQGVKPNIRNRETWFRACNMVDINSLQSNLTITHRYIVAGTTEELVTHRFDKDKFQTYTIQGILSSYSAYQPDLNLLMRFGTLYKNWEVFTEDPTHFGEIPNQLKDYFDNHQDRFEWSAQSDNFVRINLLEGDFKCADIEFFDDTKLFKSIYLWLITEEGQEVSWKFFFTNYNTTMLDDNFPSDFYNTKSIDTTVNRKTCIYDHAFPGSPSLPAKLKFYLNSNKGKLPMWQDERDLPTFSILKPDRRVDILDFQHQCFWDATTNELTVNTSDKIKAGDRLFISVSYPKNIVAKDIELIYEPISESFKR